MMQASSTTFVSFPELGWGPWTLQRFLVEDLFGGLTIAWYGVIICCAMILACAIILYNATKREGFVTDSFLDYFIFAIPLGVVGARAMYVLAKLEEYESFGEAIAIWNGGLAIYGAVITGIVTVLILAKIKKHNPLQVFDAVIPGLLIAQSIGRWGNFINGEAYGETITGVKLPWGMVVNGVGPVHPAFLYESLITFTGFLLAMFVVYRFKKIHGQVFCFYLIWYGLGRTLVEGIRTDSLMIGSLRLAQCIGLASVFVGIAMLVLLQVFRKEPDASEKENLAEAEEEIDESERTIPLRSEEEAAAEMAAALQTDDEKLSDNQEKTEETEDGTDH